MSMNRNDALAQLARGIAKFNDYTAGELLEVRWTGLRGLCAKDIEYFRKHSEKPVQQVAAACMSRTGGPWFDVLEGAA